MNTNIKAKTHLYKKYNKFKNPNDFPNYKPLRLPIKSQNPAAYDEYY